MNAFRSVSNERERKRERERKVRSESKSCRIPERMQGGGITEPVVSRAIFATPIPSRRTIKRYFAVDVDEPDRGTAHHFETSTGSRSRP